jgi:hypothetical protein
MRTGWRQIGFMVAETLTLAAGNPNKIFGR